MLAARGVSCHFKCQLMPILSIYILRPEKYNPKRKNLCTELKYCRIQLARSMSQRCSLDIFNCIGVFRLRQLL